MVRIATRVAAASNENAVHAKNKTGKWKRECGELFGFDFFAHRGE